MPLQTRSPGFRLSALSTTQEKKGLFPPALEFTWLRCSAATAQQQPRLARERGELPVRTRLLPASLLWSSPGIPLGRSPCRLPTGSPSAQPEVSGKTQRLKSKRTNFSLSFLLLGALYEFPRGCSGVPTKGSGDLPPRTHSNPDLCPSERDSSLDPSPSGTLPLTPWDPQ